MHTGLGRAATAILLPEGGLPLAIIVAKATAPPQRKFGRMFITSKTQKHTKQER